MVCLVRVVAKRERWSVTVAEPDSTSAVVGWDGEGAFDCDETASG
jgi:hypothetical protein